MTISDTDRVREARRRLREATSLPTRLDPAVRIVTLTSPRAGGVDLELQPRFAVVSGLTGGALDELLATVEALQRNTPRVGFGGEVLVDGRLLPLHDPAIGPALAGSATGSTRPTELSDEDFGQVVDALEAAVSLTSAELRGADALARELRSEDVDPPDVIDLRSADADRLEIKETLDALDAIEPEPKLLDELDDLVARAGSEDERLVLQSTVEQYSAALANLLPSDPAEVRTQLEDALDLAMNERQVLERAHRSELGSIVDVLADMGVRATVDDALEVGRRVLSERDEISAIRERLRAKLTVPAPRPPNPEPSPELAALERRTLALKRRLRSQRHLLASANGVLDPGQLDEHGRPVPVVIVDTSADLPADLTQKLLLLLSHIGDTHQVIYVSDEPEILDWARSAGDHGGWTRARGWFAGESEPC